LAKIVENGEISDANIGPCFQENVSVAQIQSTDLRFNDQYVLWYNNVTRLFVTGDVR
jgi:hypothetical protein